MSSGLVDLLGDKFLNSQGEVATADALAGSGAVALYFSAHWCPPCQGFTPKLAGWYGADLKAKGLEVVFVSSDRDEESFKSYFGEMPWLALPFADRDRKEALSKKFKVQGIPSVVVLDREGNVITKDGRAAISSDPKGEDFPWKPKSLQEILSGAKIVGKDGQQVKLEDKVFALYFSAHWCPPCRGFTPKLAEWYSKSLKAKGLEVVFVSSDRDEASFKDYYGEQPWLALEYSDRKVKEQLSNLFGVRGIPTLVIVDKDGSTITKDGKSAVSGDPEGAEFPWYPKPVANLAQGPGNLNEAPVVVALCETSSPAAKKAAEEAMTPLARRYLDAAKAAGEETPEVGFMIATEQGNIAGQLRKLCSLPAVEGGAEAPPKLMLLDIDSDGAFYEGPEGEITADVVEQLVKDFKVGALDRKQLQK